MTMSKAITGVVGIVMIITNVYSEDIITSKIFEKVRATYESMQTYKAEGAIVADIDNDGKKMNTETSFSILLKKPNLYLISWTQKNIPVAGMIQDAAVWSDGTQPYLYMGMMNAYSKMSNDKLALASATGISGGAAFTIPSLFFSVFKELSAPFSTLKDPKIEKTEKVGDEDCYVVSGASALSKKETFWISKSRYLIVKYARLLEPSENGVLMPEMTDEQLNDIIKGMGQKVTEENRKSIRETMSRSRDVLKTEKMQGSSMETHMKISSPELNKTDFQFIPPKSAVMKDSLFDGVLKE